MPLRKAGGNWRQFYLLPSGYLDLLLCDDGTYWGNQSYWVQKWGRDWGRKQSQWLRDSQSMVNTEGILLLFLWTLHPLLRIYFPLIIDKMWHQPVFQLFLCLGVIAIAPLDRGHSQSASFLHPKLLWGITTHFRNKKQRYRIRYIFLGQK